MEMVDLTKLRVYIDNKVASNIVSLGIQIDEKTMPFAQVNVHQRFPAEGLFNSGVEERVTGYVLENWRDEVLRLRSIGSDGKVSPEVTAGEGISIPPGVGEISAADETGEEEFLEDPEEVED